MRTLCILLLTTLAAFGQNPLWRNSWSTNQFPPVLGTNLMVSNIASGDVWKFHGVDGTRIARMSDLVGGAGDTTAAGTNVVIVTNLTVVTVNATVSQDMVSGASNAAIAALIATNAQTLTALTNSTNGTFIRTIAGQGTNLTLHGTAGTTSLTITNHDGTNQITLGVDRNGAAGTAGYGSIYFGRGQGQGIGWANEAAIWMDYNHIGSFASHELHLDTQGDISLNYAYGYGGGHVQLGPSGRPGGEVIIQHEGRWGMADGATNFANSIPLSFATRHWAGGPDPLVTNLNIQSVAQDTNGTAWLTFYNPGLDRVGTNYVGGRIAGQVKPTGWALEGLIESTNLDAKINAGSNVVLNALIATNLQSMTLTTNLINTSSNGSAAYAESLLSSVGAHLYFTSVSNTPSFDPTNTQWKANSFVGSGAVTTNSAEVLTNDHYFAAYVSTNTYQGFAGGAVSVELWCFESEAGSVDITPEFYLWDGTNLTELAAGTPKPVPTSLGSLTWFVNIAETNCPFPVTPVVRFKASSLVAGTPAVLMLIDGTYDSHMAFPIISGAFATTTQLAAATNNALTLSSNYTANTVSNSTNAVLSALIATNAATLTKLTNSTNNVLTLATNYAMTNIVAATNGLRNWLTNGASFNGTFAGDGTGLTNVTASATTNYPVLWATELYTTYLLPSTGSNMAVTLSDGAFVVGFQEVTTFSVVSNDVQFNVTPLQSSVGSFFALSNDVESATNALRNSLTNGMSFNGTFAGDGAGLTNLSGVASGTNFAGILVTNRATVLGAVSICTNAPDARLHIAPHWPDANRYLMKVEIRGSPALATTNAFTIDTNGAVTIGGVGSAAEVGILTLNSRLRIGASSSSFVELHESGAGYLGLTSPATDFIGIVLGRDSTSASRPTNCAVQIRKARSFASGTHFPGVKLTDQSDGTNGAFLELKALMPTTTNVVPETDCIVLFATTNASGVAQSYVMQEDGTLTQFSPHAIDAPPAFYIVTNWVRGIQPTIRMSRNMFSGTIEWNNDSLRSLMFEWMMRGSNIAALKLTNAVHVIETFESYNLRTGAKLVTLNWTNEQNRIQAAYDAERFTQLVSLTNAMAEFATNSAAVTNVYVKPAAVVKKPLPVYLQTKTGAEVQE